MQKSVEEPALLEKWLGFVFKMSKYEILVKILDQLRKEAPSKIGRYYPSNESVETLNQIRARTFIHLFLKVKFGLTDFQQRENFITDDAQDGGIDAYFIDNDTKRIYLIQSKFRINQTNFQSREILYSDLLKMEVERILEGEELDDSGVAYNGRIRRMVEQIGNIPDIARWSYEIIILANVNQAVTQSQLKKLTGGLPTEIFNYERVYQELVFPVIQGTYYNSDELEISIDLSSISTPSPLEYKAKTAATECEIMILFVPTIEVAKILYKYRNSILKYNPRSYLELSRNNVNQAIKRTITECQTNEFALFNNGITVLSFGTFYGKRSGKLAQLMITQPQIINGGQTAYTLSRLYEEKIQAGQDPEEIFLKKEVLLKVITFNPDDGRDSSSYLDLIEEISRATNQQSPVGEADRRSNDQIQIKLQKFVFDNYGYFYERKRGEFGDGIREKYIDAGQIINREDFLRICHCCDMKPSEAWRSMGRQFDQEIFNQIINDEARFSEYFFAYKCFEFLTSIKVPKSKSKRADIEKYGSSLTYGKYAVIAACRTKYEDGISTSNAEEVVRGVLEAWLDFENFAVELATNSTYFSNQERSFNNYYKGPTINQDIFNFFQARDLSSTENGLN